MDKPDWKKAEDYKYTEGIELAAWAWEFLRRDKDYQADYMVYKTKAQDLEQQYGDWKKEKDALCYVPEQLDGETKQKWMVRAADMGITSERIRLDHLMGRKWFLKGMFDPDKSFQQGIVFLRPQMFPVYADKLDDLDVYTTRDILYDGEGNPVGVIEDVFPAEYVVVVYDLVHDIAKQAKQASKELKKRAKSIKSDNTVIKPQVWVRHLRVLDAINSTSPPSYDEIANTLGYNESRYKQNEEPPSKMGFEYVEAAKVEIKRIPVKILRRLSSN